MTKDDVVAQKAEQANALLADSGFAGIDSGTWGKIIDAVISLFKGCGLSPAQAQKRARNPRRLDRLRVRRLLRDKGVKDDEAVEEVLAEVAAKVTVAQMKVAYGEK